jgi:hypothetical protein
MLVVYDHKLLVLALIPVLGLRP